MNIINNSNKINTLKQVSKYNKAKQNQETKKTKKQEIGIKFEISNEAKKLQKQKKYIELAKKNIKELPDIREGKVSEIKKQIKNGTYNPKTENVAQKMINRYI